MSFTEEEKIKILYEQSLCDIRELVKRLEKVAASVTDSVKELKRTETDSYKQSSRSLDSATNSIRLAMQQVTNVKDGMEQAAASAARSVLLGESGPLVKLDALVRNQRDALQWLNRAAKIYSSSRLSAALVGLSCALIGGLIVKLL